MLLGQDILLVLIGHGALVDSRQASLLTVAITVPRTASKPTELFHLLRHLQFEAELRQDGACVLWTDKRVGHNRTIGADDEVETHVEDVGTATIDALHTDRDGLAVFCLRYGGRGALGRCAELGQVHTVPGALLAAVIIRRQTESAKIQRFAEHGCAVDGIAGQRTLSLGEGSCEVSACDGDGGTCLVHGEGIFIGKGEVLHGFRGSLHGQFFLCHHITGFCPGCSLFLFGAEIDEEFHFGIMIRGIYL